MLAWLRDLLGNSPAVELAKELGCDMHSHFIPGIDDGAETLEQSLEMIRAMQALGYRKLITTPHIMSDFYRNTPEIIRGGLAKLREAIQQEGIPIEVEAAAEYYCDHAFEKMIGTHEILTFSGKKVLMELSYMNPSDNFDTVTFKLQTEGYTPVLAHPERYPYWYHNIEQYANIREKGVLLQVNIGSIAGYYGTGAKRIAERLIERNLVDLLGSDAHKMGHIALIEKVSKERALHQLLDSGRLINQSL
ncbi:MAG: capsular biosynthesis protein [Bacteroidia bacterium]|jgi:tyrosine-protein phosphatase YwqE|nr:capsular biosynthesis protein [Bacteroidia bacterium]MCC6768214.1 capsular biosynthesis protein [Bacteroidia bacterium]